MEKGLADKLLLVKQGTLVDASLVGAHSHPPRRGTSDPKDPDAAWTVKRGKPNSYINVVTAKGAPHEERSYKVCVEGTPDCKGK